MKGRMKVAVLEGIGKAAVRVMNIPETKRNQILVKIHNCNICTSDWQVWAGLRQALGREFPFAAGHEAAGEIVEIGEDVKTDLKVGMHVGIGSIFSIGCGGCHYCQSGHQDRCLNRPPHLVINGVRGNYAMSQYCVYEVNRLYKINDDIPYNVGGFLEPISTVVHGVKRARIVPGDNVLVIGAGNLGLINAQVAREYGGNVIVSEINEERCSLSESLGFKTINPGKTNLKEAVMGLTNNIGADVVIVAVGLTAANNQALEVLAPMGRVLLFAAGYPEPEINVGSNKVHYKEYELIGTYNSGPSDYKIAVDLLNNNRVKVDKLISCNISIDRVQEAFEIAATPGKYRVSLSMWE
jgi:L-iditol 2-dehydrogenase